MTENTAHQGSKKRVEHVEGQMQVQPSVGELGFFLDHLAREVIEVHPPEAKSNRDSKASDHPALDVVRVWRITEGLNDLQHSLSQHNDREEAKPFGEVRAVEGNLFEGEEINDPLQDEAGVPQDEPIGHWDQERAAKTNHRDDVCREVVQNRPTHGGEEEENEEVLHNQARAHHDETPNKTH